MRRAVRRGSVAILATAATVVAGCAAPTNSSSSVSSVGDGIRTPFTVTGPARPVGDVELADATTDYKRYATGQVQALVPKTQEFADAVEAKNVNEAKALFPVARTGWESIEPIAESLDDIDSRIDAREQDQRPPGVAWTGFHRLEKDLWSTGCRPTRQ